MLHKMKLQPNPFYQIKSGRKTIEIRLNDEKRKLVSIGDEIEFSNIDDQEHKILTKVTGLTTAKTLKDLFDKIGTYDAGWEHTEGSAQAAQDMHKYYSEEKELQYGALGIHVELISSK